MTHRTKIVKFLQSIRQRLLLQEALRSLSWVALASGLLAPPLFLIGSAAYPFVLLALTFLLLFWLVRLVWVGRKLWPLSGVALWAEEKSAFFRGYLLGAFELSGGLRPGESLALANAVITSAEEKLSERSPSRLVSLWPPARRSYWSFASFLLLGIALWLTPKSSSEENNNVVQVAPVVGDLFVRYDYPKYSQLPPREIEGLSGVISALKGTRVSLKTRADRPVQAAKIVIDGKAKEIPLRVKAGRDLFGEFPLLESTNFRFVIQEEGGRWVAGPSQEMKAEADLLPKVALLSPTTDLEVKEISQLDLEVSVEDDFGLRALRIVFEVGGLSAPQAIEVTSFPERKKSFRGVLHQPLEMLHLQEGDRVRYYVEALDNDVVSGPKRGASEARYLKIFSAKEHHKMLIEQQAKLVEELAAHLGARIEDPFPLYFEEEKKYTIEADVEAAHAAEIFSKLAVQGEKLTGQLDEITLSLGEDPLSHLEIRETLHQIASRLTMQSSDARESAKSLRGALSQSADLSGSLSTAKALNQKAIKALEEDLFALDQLVKRQRAEGIRELGEMINAAKARLQELIEEYEKTKDPALKEQIQREIERLEALLKELQEDIAHMQQEMPEEFFNLEALKPDEMQSGLSQMKDAFSRDDISGAKRALQQLSEALSSTQEQLDAQAERFQDEAQQARDSAAEALINEIADLEAKERALIQATQTTEEAARGKAEEANRESIEGAKTSAREKLSSLVLLLSELDADALSDEAIRILSQAKARAEELDAAITTKPLKDALAAAKPLEEALGLTHKATNSQIKEEEERNDIFGRLSAVKEATEKIAAAQKLAKEISSLLQKATPDLAAYLSEEEKRALQDLATSQREIKDALKPLQEKLSMLNTLFNIAPTAKDQEAPKEAPPIGSGQDAIFKDIIKAAEAAMDKATGSLRAEQPTPAITHEQEALAQLEALRQAIKSAGNQRSQGRSKGQSVKIPTAEEYEPPRDYRDEVIEGSKEKEKAPAQYQEALKKYYQELLQ